jgi:hypothetical protein
MVWQCGALCYLVLSRMCSVVCGVCMCFLQEDDRDYLIRQLVAVKKDNARLRQEITSLREEAEALKAAANDNVGNQFALCPTWQWQCVPP